MHKTLIFEHIPKTAGSTLRFILVNEYKKVFTTNSHDLQSSINKFEKLGDIRQNKFDVIQGHGASQLTKKIKNPVFLTYLRDPVDRFISQYYFIRRNPKHRTYNSLKAVNSIEEYLDFAIKFSEDNFQTRFLSDSVMSVFGDIKPDNGNQDRKLLLQEAKNNLQSFDYVFFTHHFDLSLLILRNELNWKRTPYYITKNKTKNRPLKSGFSDKVLEKIREVEIYDMELFELAKTLNNKILANYNLDRELEIFQKKNVVHRPITLANHYKNKVRTKMLNFFGLN